MHGMPKIRFAIHRIRLALADGQSLTEMEIIAATELDRNTVVRCLRDQNQFAFVAGKPRRFLLRVSEATDER